MTTTAWSDPWTPLARELQRGADMASGTDTAVEAAAHRSLFVPGELHLGPLGECRHCGPYCKEGDAHQ